MEVLFQGLQAAWPGVGTTTALQTIARTRGLIRWQDETDAAFTTRLRAWLDTWRTAGSSIAMARQIRGYLRTKPLIRVFTRTGIVTQITAAGVETTTATGVVFNWDGTSHPSRSGHWSDLFVVVYHGTPGVAGTQWDYAGSWGVADAQTWNETSGLGFGQGVNREEYDAISGLIAQWKAAHSSVRIIWTSDALLFVPGDPFSMPDGQWGEWIHPTIGGSSSRNLSTCRYWEFPNAF